MRQDQDGNKKETDPTSSSQPPPPPPAASWSLLHDCWICSTGIYTVPKRSSTECSQNWLFSKTNIVAYKSTFEPNSKLSGHAGSGIKLKICQLLNAESEWLRVAHAPVKKREKDWSSSLQLLGKWFGDNDTFWQPLFTFRDSINMW